MSITNKKARDIQKTVDKAVDYAVYEAVAKDQNFMEKFEERISDDMILDAIQEVMIQREDKRARIKIIETALKLKGLLSDQKLKVNGDLTMNQVVINNGLPESTIIERIEHILRAIKSVECKK